MADNFTAFTFTYYLKSLYSFQEGKKKATKLKVRKPAKLKRTTDNKITENQPRQDVWLMKTNIVDRNTRIVSIYTTRNGFYCKFLQFDRSNYL